MITCAPYQRGCFCFRCIHTKQYIFYFVFFFSHYISPVKFVFDSDLFVVVCSRRCLFIGWLVGASTAAACLRLSAGHWSPHEDFPRGPGPTPRPHARRPKPSVFVFALLHTSPGYGRRLARSRIRDRPIYAVCIERFVIGNVNGCQPAKDKKRFYLHKKSV